MRAGSSGIAGPRFFSPHCSGLFLALLGFPVPSEPKFQCGRRRPRRPPACVPAHPPPSTPLQLALHLPRLPMCLPTSLGAFAWAAPPQSPRPRNMLLSFGLTPFHPWGWGALHPRHFPCEASVFTSLLLPNPPAEGSPRSLCLFFRHVWSNLLLGFCICVLSEDVPDPELCVREDRVCLGACLPAQLAPITHWCCSGNVR